MYKVFFVSLIFVFSCATQMEKSQLFETETDDMPIEGIDFVILHYNLDVFGEYFKNSTQTELTVNDLKDINDLLKKAVESYNKNWKADFGYKDDIVLSNYQRQYIAVIDENGEKIVYINCFRRTTTDYWKTKLIEVDDGGDRYFDVIINLTTKTHWLLAPHGLG